MKKKYSLIAVLLIAVILVFGCLFFQNRSHEEKEEKKTLRVGVTLYRGDDSFINNLCGKMEAHKGKGMRLCFYACASFCTERKYCLGVMPYSCLNARKK